MPQSSRSAQDSPVRGSHLPRHEARPRILLIKLSDFGDALLTRPALAQLRGALPAAQIEVLTTPIGAQAYRHMGLADRIQVFERSAYDRPADLLRRPGTALELVRELREARYDAVALLHSLTTRRGAIKHAGLVLATGAGIRIGLRRPGSPRGAFLSHAAEDPGFDARHVVESGEAVVGRLLEVLHDEGVGAGISGLEKLPVQDPWPGPKVGVGSTDAPRHLDFRPGPQAEALARDLLARLDAPDGKAGPLVALHPGSGGFSLARRWSPAGFAAVADGLAAEGARLVLVGQASDDTAALRAAMATEPALDLCERLDLPGLAAVLASMQLLIANDSGVMHLATAVGTPVVAVFGPSNPVAWGPWWPGVDRRGRPAESPHRIVRLGLPCQPCLYRGYRLGSREGCPSRDCLAWLEPQRVLAEARSALLAGGSRGAVG